MPCRDYESDTYDRFNDLKRQCDRLARVACDLAEALHSTISAEYTTATSKEIDATIKQKVTDETWAWVVQHRKADAKAKSIKAAKIRVIEAEYKAEQENYEASSKAYQNLLKTVGPNDLSLLNIQPPKKIKSLKRRLTEAGFHDEVKKYK